MQNRAQVLADFYAQTGTDVAFATVYSDGVILYVVFGPRTQFELEEYLSDQLVERARSADDTCGALILPITQWGATLDRVAAWLDSRGLHGLVYKDNRTQDAHTIDLYCDMLRPQSV